MAFAEIARGLSDLQVSTLDASGAPTTWVDIPGIRSLNFNTEADSDELEGANTIIAKVQNATSLSGSLELGQIPLAGLAVILGSTVNTTGVTPDQISELEQVAEPGVNYYAIVGQAPGVDVAGSAYRATIRKALTVSGPDETMETGTWNTPTIDFEGLPVAGVLVTRAQYETAAALPPV